jgi:hypothetical protein
MGSVSATSTLRDGGMTGHGVLDLGRVHVLPAGDDHVLDPVDDIEVTLVVSPTVPFGTWPPSASTTRTSACGAAWPAERTCPCSCGCCIK